MRRTYAFLLLLVLIFTSGAALSQTVPVTPETTPEATPEIAFQIEAEIGRALPRKIVYDPQRERMAVADAYNRLLLVNALDYSTIAVLHERGQYGDITFSHDGRWLAVAYNVTMELWDTDTGTRVATLDNLNAKQLIGPMAFSSQDDILVFYGIYPAPRALRRTETDTIVYPWVWHLPAARGEAPSSFPNGLKAVQMFDYAFGFVLSPDDKIVAALPARLRVMDAHSLKVEYEIPTDRYEQDPLNVWLSLRDNTIYVRPVTTDTLLQVDTRRGVLVEIPMNTDLSPDDLSLIGGLEVGSMARVVGGTASRRSNPLLQVFLGYYYRDVNLYGSRPLTVTLLDLVVPPTGTSDNVRALLYVFDEDSQTGRFRFSETNAAQQMVISPNGERVLMRRNDGDEYIITYDLSSGQEVRRILPALRAIGSYRRNIKNRVLAFDKTGEVIISDFQRLDAATQNVLAEDLRYSRSFDRFFWSADSQKIITLAGTEWREWSVATGEVLRREVVRLQGSIIATSSDGYRYLSQFSTDSGGGGVQVVDMNTLERYTVSFAVVPGSSVAEVYANPSWTRFLVIYSENQYGPYSPGNQVAIYDYRAGQTVFVAGDDLPPIGYRQYGWVDDETAYVYGQGAASDLPGRVYGVDYARSGLPACIAQAYPEQVNTFLNLWERLVLRLRADQLDRLSQSICATLPDTAAGVEQRLRPTPVPTYLAVTGVPTGEVPQCLKDRYPGQVEQYSAAWRAMTLNSTPEERQRLAVLLCEGIGEIRPEDTFDPSLGITLFINAQTGARASGAYQPPVVERRPLEPVYDLFQKTENRSLGTAILSPDADLLAASSLPGELIIYRLIVTYDSIMQQVTATAAAQLAQANLIQAMPSSSPTYNAIGTPRPTLTPTPKQTLYPRPQERVFADSEQIDLCPSETLFTIRNLPPGYDATGRLYAEVYGDVLWGIEPETGTRREDPDIIRCGKGIQCQFSPDNAWILAESYEAIYITRPDKSDPRVLWDLRTPYPATPVPRDLWWSGDRTIEWSARIPITAVPTSAVYYVNAYIRDVMNVYPDPPPWIPDVTINTIPTVIESRQPGGPWVVAYTSYNTGVGTGLKYYLYNSDTREYRPFAQSEIGKLNLFWHPLGDRLFYRFPLSNGRYSEVYEVRFPEVNNRQLGDNYAGPWSNDGRYRVFNTQSRAQPVAVWDSQTNLVRTYCLPETGARLYQGSFTWSPDNRYVALIAPLPKDEAQAGVGAHTLILNVETGEVVDLTTGVVNILVWAQEPGTYGDGRVVTPTPTLTATAAP